MKKLIFAAFVILAFGILFMTCQEGMSPGQVSQEADPPQIESCEPPTDPPTPPQVACGRMTGGGSVFFIEDENGKIRVRVTRGFQIHCDLTKPNNLQVNWKGGKKFHLTELTYAFCWDDPNIEPDPPGAPFDSFRGGGSGRFNKDENARIEFLFKDAGEPGVDDYAEIRVFNSSGVEKLHVYGNLEKGNLQAHDDKCE